MLISWLVVDVLILDQRKSTTQALFLWGVVDRVHKGLSCLLRLCHH
jgi:hypothetical protein